MLWSLERHLHPDGKTLNAFCTHDSVRIDGARFGPLAGLTFAAKDIFDVEGRTACCGNPDWLATHSPTSATAPVIRQLLEAGASLVGMTITEELVMGLTGENPFYGTPVNVAAPGRVCGGSSSGSASVVAAGLVDFAIGSDTGGSVRVPASFCGIYGIRPTHGRVSLGGVMPFAPSLDTVGWLAVNAKMMRRISEVVVDHWKSSHSLTARRLIVARDAFAVVGPHVRRALEPAVERLSQMIGSRNEIDMAGDAHLESWSKLMAIFREAEGWASHRDWIDECHPKLSPNAEMRMELGARISPEQFAEAIPARDRVRERMDDLLRDDAVLALPAAPDVAPMRGGDLEAIWALVQKNGQINAAAALAGLPQISCPVGAIDGLPFGLGLIAPRGGDELLLEIAERLEHSLRESDLQKSARSRQQPQRKR